MIDGGRIQVKQELFKCELSILADCPEPSGKFRPYCCIRILSIS